MGLLACNVAAQLIAARVSQAPESADSAIWRVLQTGVPIYAVAEGDARHSEHLPKQLRGLAERTGGIYYQAKTARDIHNVFRDIRAELRHIYLLTYKPPVGDAAKWRAIEIRSEGGNSTYSPPS